MTGEMPFRKDSAPVLRCLLVALCLSGASPAVAGPWPREDGAGFFSATARFVWPYDAQGGAARNTYLTLYSEYGLTDRLTGGLDLGHSVSGDSKMIAFLRLPLPAPEGWAMATELGFGSIAGETVFRPTLSVGRGLDGPRGAGWISLEGTVEYGLGTGETDLKLDATWGQALPGDRVLIFQVQGGQPAGEPAFLRLAPSLVTPLRGGLRAEVGVTVGLAGNTGLGLLFGLWRDF